MILVVVLSNSTFCFYVLFDFDFLSMRFSKFIAITHLRQPYYIIIFRPPCQHFSKIFLKNVFDVWLPSNDNLLSLSSMPLHVNPHLQPFFKNFFLPII